MECQKMNYDPKQFSSELVKSLKSRKIKKENPGPAQETRIESEWQIEPEEEVLAELIVPVHQCPVVDIHASMMNPTGQIISEGNFGVFKFPKKQAKFFRMFLPQSLKWVKKIKLKVTSLNQMPPNYKLVLYCAFFYLAHLPKRLVPCS